MPEIQNEREPNPAPPPPPLHPTHVCEMPGLSNTFECMYGKMYQHELWNSGIGEAGLLLIAAVFTLLWWRLRK